MVSHTRCKGTSIIGAKRPCAKPDVHSHQQEIITMSNSSRIEAATRQHVNQTLNSATITELVKKAYPDFKGGVYPSDVAYVRKEGKLVPRGKMAYGDGVLEHLAENSFKVLPTDEIVRRKAPVAAAPAPAPVAAKPSAKVEKKSSKKASQPPVATKPRGAVGRSVVQ
jgi:hypothetical protein